MCYSSPNIARLVEATRTVMQHAWGERVYNFWLRNQAGDKNPIFILSSVAYSTERITSSLSFVTKSIITQLCEILKHKISDRVEL
jgi:GDP-D-mannose dehydratase